MQDLFYFTKSQIGISELAHIALALGHKPEKVVTHDGEQLSIHDSKGELSHWIPIDPLGRDFSTFESPQQEKILSSEPQCGFIVSFHSSSNNGVIRLLGQVIDRHGGWVGVDDNKFESIFDSSNIERLVESFSVPES